MNIIEELNNLKKQLKTKEKLLNEALSDLKEQRTVDFEKKIIALHKNLTRKDLWEKFNEDFFNGVLDEMKGQGQVNNMSSLSKGFLSLRAGYEENAYKCLSAAINKNTSEDLVYSLRSFIQGKLNPNRIEDAKMAALLNPTARNYFILGEVLFESKEKSNRKKALLFYDKAFQKKPDIGYAFYKKYLSEFSDETKIIRNIQNGRNNVELTGAMINFDSGNYSRAVKHFKKIIANDKSYLSKDYTYRFFKALLKENNGDINLNSKNSIYGKIVKNLRKRDKWAEFIDFFPEYSDNDKFMFGKYEGSTIQQTIQENPRYILWCIINIADFVVESGVLLHKKLFDQDNYLKALEYQVLKSRIFEDEMDSILEDEIEMESKPLTPRGWRDVLGPEEASQAYWNTH